MRQSTAQSSKSGYTEIPGRKLATRTNTRRPSTSPYMLSTWQNPRLNKKSSKTLHPASLIFSRSPTKWDGETWMSKTRKLSAVTLDSCDWWQGQASCQERAPWAPLELLVLGLSCRNLPRGKPSPPHPTWSCGQGHQAHEKWQGCWYICFRNRNAESFWSGRDLADPWSIREPDKQPISHCELAHYTGFFNSIAMDWI